MWERGIRALSHNKMWERGIRALSHNKMWERGIRALSHDEMWEKAIHRAAPTTQFKSHIGRGAEIGLPGAERAAVDAIGLGQLQELLVLGVQNDLAILFV